MAISLCVAVKTIHIRVLYSNNNKSIKIVCKTCCIQSVVNNFAHFTRDEKVKIQAKFGISHDRDPYSLLMINVVLAFECKPPYKN